MLKFSDGVNIDTTGDIRTTMLPDGLYVVGKGMLIPVKDYKEARKVMEELKNGK